MNGRRKSEDDIVLIWIGVAAGIFIFLLLWIVSLILAMSTFDQDDTIEASLSRMVEEGSRDGEAV